MQPTAAELEAAAGIYWAAGFALVGCVVAIAAAWVKIARIRMNHELTLRATEEGLDLGTFLEHQRRGTLGAYLAWGAVLLALGIGFMVGDFVVIREAIKGRPEEGMYLLGLGWNYALLLAGAALLVVYAVLRRQDQARPARLATRPNETGPPS